MNRTLRRFCVAFGLLTAVAQCFAQQATTQPATAPTTIVTLLPRIQQNVRELLSSLPDFVCDERITSRSVGDGAEARQVIVESHFIGRQSTKPVTGSIYPFTESREIITTNGRKAGRDQTLRLPFFFDGGFSSLLNVTFGPDNTPFHNYAVSGVRDVNGKAVIVVSFATKDDQNTLAYFVGGKRYLDRDAGEAWVDPRTSDVLHIERRFNNRPKGEGTLVASVEYARVQIEGKSFWLPKTVRASQKSRGEYTAEYTNYRKFSVSTGITFNGE